MSRDPIRGPGERIVHICIGALVCAICLSLTVELLQTLWPWLLVAALIGLPIAFMTWRNRRW